MASIEIDAETYGTMVGNAVMNSITGDQRDRLIAAAIQHLLAPSPTYSGGPKVTPLQTAFNQAVDNYARKFVMAELESNGELALRLKSVIIEATEKVFTTEREKIVGKVAEAITAAFGPRY